MPSSSPNPGDNDASLFADFLAELLAEHGLQQSQVAKAAEKVAERNTGERGRLHRVSWSTLSRTLNKKFIRPPTRAKFNTLALACLYAARETAGEADPLPDLREADRLWSQWQEFRRQSLPVELRGYRQGHQRPAAAAAAAARPAPAKPLRKDAEQLRYEAAYGRAGTALLAAARSPEAAPEAALVLALLRLLDSHPGEGETWLLTAQSLGSAEAGSLLGVQAPQERKLSAARQAVKTAASASSLLQEGEIRPLLLERAARSGLHEAAHQLAAYYAGAGEAGHAARWSTAAVRAN
ncbi:hypothetical protein ABZ234_14630 [Nocardiopsis sp. NPDC006198]|uniref:hypothetical protein n=1 Tax=Nocardiopsis sp. NPDC006198 TaxID=3154472 RepID=UPI00339F0CB6